MYRAVYTQADARIHLSVIQLAEDAGNSKFRSLAERKIQDDAPVFKALRYWKRVAERNGRYDNSFA